MPKAWDKMNNGEKLEYLKNQNAARRQDMARVARMLDQVVLRTIACIAVVGAMSETSRPDQERVNLWCGALRQNIPSIPEASLEAKAAEIIAMLPPLPASGHDPE